MPQALTIFIFLLASFSANGRTVNDNSRLISFRPISEISVAKLDSVRRAAKIPRSLASIKYDVQIYEVIYRTQNHKGREVQASGLYLVPVQLKTGMPALSYNHGTRLIKKRNEGLQGEELLGFFFASDGYAVCWPDYIGLGKGEGRHLYHHANTEALANVDLLRAARELNTVLNRSFGDHLFISGYSQGGHAALATHKYIQEHLQDEFSVTASAPMSGAYDMGGAQEKVMWKPYSDPGYLPYLIFSFQEAYEIFPENRSPFKAPFDSLLPPLFDGNHKLYEVNQILPDVPVEILRDDLLKEYLEDEHHPLRKAMEANTLLNWKPERPVLLCYCKSDEQVNYRNTLAAWKNMRNLGAKHVKKRHSGKKFDHEICALYSTLYTKMWFDSFLNGSQHGRHGPVRNRFLIRLSRMLYKG